MNLLLSFTSNVSLKDWNDLGLLNREISLYKRLTQIGVNVNFLTYGDESDLKFSEILKNINIIPCFNYIKSKNSKVAFIKKLLLPFKLRNIIKEIDIIKTNQLQGSSVAWISKLLYRKKIIIRGGYERLHSYIIKTKRKGIKNYIKYLFNYCMIYFSELIAFKLADSIIMTSEREIAFNIKCFKLKKKIKKVKFSIFIILSM